MRRLVRLFLVASFIYLPVSTCFPAASCCCKGCPGDTKAPLPTKPCCNVEPAPDTNGSLPTRIMVEKMALLGHLAAPAFAVMPLPPCPVARWSRPADTGPPGSILPLRV